MNRESQGCSCSFTVLSSVTFRYSGPGSVFGPEVSTSKRHLTYSDRLTTQAGLQKGLKMAQIAKNTGKDRATAGHELIRYVIPKSQAEKHYTEGEIREMMSHINSYPREKWNGQAPIDLFAKIYGQEAAEFLGLRKIPLDFIHLTPVSPKE